MGAQSETYGETLAASNGTDAAPLTTALSLLTCAKIHNIYFKVNPFTEFSDHKPIETVIYELLMWMIFGVSGVSPIFASKQVYYFSYGLGMGTSVLYSKYQPQPTTALLFFVFWSWLG